MSQQAPRDGLAYVALAAFVAVMYAAFGEWLAWARPLRLALLTSAVAAVAMILARFKPGRTFSFDGLRGGALVALAAWAGLSSTWSIFPSESQRTAIELLKLVAIYFTCINIVTSWERLEKLILVMMAASIVTSIGVIRWYQAGVNMVEGYRSRWVGVYADPNHMAMAMVLVVPLGVSFLVRKELNGWWRVIGALAAGLAVIAMVLSYSRGGFLGLGVGMLLWAVRQKNRVHSLLIGAVLFTGLLAWAPSSFWRRTQTVATFEEDASAMGRVYAWQVASNINKDRPLLGVGAGSFRFAWPLYAPPEARRAYVAHNVFLDVLGELGLVGFILFLIFIGKASDGTWLASSDERGGWLARALSASIAAYLVCDLFSGYLLSAHLYVLLALGACAHRISSPVLSPGAEKCPNPLA